MFISVHDKTPPEIYPEVSDRRCDPLSFSAFHVSSISIFDLKPVFTNPLGFARLCGYSIRTHGHRAYFPAFEQISQRPVNTEKGFILRSLSVDTIQHADKKNACGNIHLTTTSHTLRTYHLFIKPY